MAIAGTFIALLIIDVIGYIIRTKLDSQFAVANTRLYPFMWIFYRSE